jgi:hypothetical protein
MAKRAMESTKTPGYHFERALFVVGEQNAGKSVQLRSMFRDYRLGARGRILAKNKVKETYSLSNERWLYLRLTSPHETWECIEGPNGENFLDKTEGKLRSNRGQASRWNFACPLQPAAFRNMPDVVDTVEAFVTRFRPERTRVAFLSPDRKGLFLQERHARLVRRLLRIASVEVCWISARDREANGLFLADFFDFT